MGELDWLDRLEELIPGALDDGYLFLRGLLDPLAVNALHDRVLAVAQSLGIFDQSVPVVDQHPLFMAMQQQFAGLPEAARLREDSSLCKAVARALGGGPVASRQGDVCRIQLPGHGHTYTTPPHRDGQYYAPTRVETWGAWIPLHDCPIELGPLAVSPGSHLIGGHDIRWASSHMRAGDVILVHPMLIHCGLPNVSKDRARISVDFRYCLRRSTHANSSSSPSRKN